MTIPVTRLTQIDEYRMKERRSIVSVRAIAALATIAGVLAPVLDRATATGGSFVYAAGTGGERLTANTTSGALARVTSARRVRVRAGRGVLVDVTCAMSDGGLANQRRRIGTSRHYFELTGTTLAVVTTDVSNVTTSVQQVAWSDRTTGVDLTKIHRYQIEMPPGASGTIRFLLDGDLVYQQEIAGLSVDAIADYADVSISIENTGVPLATAYVEWFSFGMAIDESHTPRSSFVVANGAGVAGTAPGIPVLTVRPRFGEEIRPRSVYLRAASDMTVEIWRDRLSTDGAAVWTAQGVAESSVTALATEDATNARLLWSGVVGTGGTTVDLSAMFEDEPLQARGVEASARTISVRASNGTAVTRAAIAWTEER